MTEVSQDQEARVRAVCDDTRARMKELRGFEVPEAYEDLGAYGMAVHTALRELRGRLDQAEVLLAETARNRRQAKRLARLAAAEYDDKFDAEMDRLAKAAMRLEYQSVHDRLAMARVHASPERRTARAAERLADFVEETEEYARSGYFAMRDIRAELLATLQHYLPWEASLER